MKTKNLSVLIQADDNKVYQVLVTKDEQTYVLDLLAQLHKGVLKCREEPLEGVVIV